MSKRKSRSGRRSDRSRTAHIVSDQTLETTAHKRTTAFGTLKEPSRGRGIDLFQFGPQTREDPRIKGYVNSRQDEMALPNPSPSPSPSPPQDDVGGMEEENKLKDLTCTVCLEIFTDPKVLPCCHTFCLECLKGILGKSAAQENISCPQCREEHKV